MIKDSNNVIVRDGDTIVTERGVKLEIKDFDGILFFINSGNNQKLELSKLNTPFNIAEDK